MQDVYAKIYLQPSLEILVAKFSHELVACLGTAAIDGWQWHAVEGIGLDHGVEGHVVKNERIADGEWLVEGIISNDVACQAGWSTKAIGVSEFVWLAGIFQRWAIRHFDDIWHMAGS